MFLLFSYYIIASSSALSYQIHKYTVFNPILPRMWEVHTIHITALSGITHLCSVVLAQVSKLVVSILKIGMKSTKAKQTLEI